MKNKGYTLIELLAIIVIIGVLGGAAIVSYTRYVTSSRNKAYDNLAQTLYDSSQNYVMDHLEILDLSSTTITDNDLVVGAYTDKLLDPKGHGEVCSADIKIIPTDVSNMAKVKYQIKLKCKDYTKDYEFFN